MDVTINFSVLTNILQFFSLLGGGVFFLVRTDQRVKSIIDHLSKIDTQIERLTAASTDIVRQDERIASMDGRIQELSNRLDTLSHKVDFTSFKGMQRKRPTTR